MILRTKLLDAIGQLTELDELSDDVLVDVLVKRLRRTKSELDEARAAIFKEGIRADRIQKEMLDERHRIRTDPLYAAHGDFYFMDRISDRILIVSIGGAHNIRVFERKDRIDYILTQISAAEYQQRVKD